MNVKDRLLTWLRSLTVGRKLALIYLLDLTAVFFITGILIREKYISIDFARKELVGVAYASAIRGALMPSLEARAGGTDQQLARTALSALLNSREHDLRPREQVDGFVSALARADTATLANQDSARNTLIAKADELLTQVGNESNLILDPDLDSYYNMSLVMLRFPKLLDVLHDAMVALKSKGAADQRRSDIRGSSSSVQANLLIQAGRMEAALLGIQADYKQVFMAGQPNLKADLQDSQSHLEKQLSEVLTLVQAMAEADVSESALRSAVVAHTSALEAVDRAWIAGNTSLKRLLDQRITGFFELMAWHLGTALLLLISILGMVTLVARQIAMPLERLASVADTVRQTGNQELRADWVSSDEIGRLYTAFNGMLEQLDQDRVEQKEMAARARGAEAQRELVESVAIPMMVTSIPDHRVLHANGPAQAWLGGQEVDPWRKGLEPAARTRMFQRLADQGQVDEFEARWLGGKEPSWAVLSARRLHYQGQDAVLTTFTPINVIKQMEQRLALWAKVFEASSESIVIFDANLRIISVNRAFERSTMYEHYDAIGQSLDLILEPNQSKELIAQVALAIDVTDAWQGEVQVKRRTGEKYPAWLMISAVRDDSKHSLLTHHIGISIDISDRKRTEERVQFLALHDPLTELPNRTLCLDRLSVAIHEARRSRKKVAVLFIDLDRFKTINDTLGHQLGDALLRSVASRIGAAIRAGDTASRLGGDEFVVILTGVQDREEVELIIQTRVIPSIRAPHFVEGRTLSVSCSVGAAMYPDDGNDIDELMRRADAAMYEAKSDGRDRSRMFEPVIDEQMRERQSIEMHLGQALQNNELSLHFQPRLDAKTMKVISAEALIRWNNPVLGPVSPARFIPIAEQTGLIRQIGAWVIEEACRHVVQWQSQIFPGMVVSINLSAAQLSDANVVNLVTQSFQNTGCNPAWAELEITESHLMSDVAVAESKLAGLKALGVQLSIDDFGTGYSSLAYLKRFPIDKLKIDQSFVRDMHTDDTDLAIVRAVIALGHSLGLDVVAEGVELPAQVTSLLSLDCDELQGFHFARPMPADEFVLWMQAHLPRTSALA